MLASKMICQELTQEHAYEEAALLQNVEVTRTKEHEVHTGMHPEWGDVHIVIPMMGSALRLFNGMTIERAVAKSKPLVMTNLDKLLHE